MMRYKIGISNCVIYVISIDLLALLLIPVITLFADIR